MLYTVTYWVRNPGATGVFWRTSRTILAGTADHARGIVFNLLHAEGFETLHPAAIVPHTLAEVPRNA